MKLDFSEVIQRVSPNGDAGCGTLDRDPVWTLRLDAESSLTVRVPGGVNAE